MYHVDLLLERETLKYMYQNSKQPLIFIIYGFGGFFLAVLYVSSITHFISSVRTARASG